MRVFRVVEEVSLLTLDPCPIVLLLLLLLLLVFRTTCAGARRQTPCFQHAYHGIYQCARARTQTHDHLLVREVTYHHPNLFGMIFSTAPCLFFSFSLV